MKLIRYDKPLAWTMQEWASDKCCLVHLWTTLTIKG